MDSRLAQLQAKAFKDENLKSALRATRSMPNPISAFCALAAENGVFITEEELITLGEESCAAMLRSQNGGGEYNPGGLWDDDYELFFLNLEGK